MDCLPLSVCLDGLSVCSGHSPSCPLTPLASYSRASVSAINRGIPVNYVPHLQVRRASLCHDLGGALQDSQLRLGSRRNSRAHYSKQALNNAKLPFGQWMMLNIRRKREDKCGIGHSLQECGAGRFQEWLPSQGPSHRPRTTLSRSGEPETRDQSLHSGWAPEKEARDMPAHQDCTHVIGPDPQDSRRSSVVLGEGREDSSWIHGFQQAGRLLATAALAMAFSAAVALNPSDLNRSYLNPSGVGLEDARPGSHLDWEGKEAANRIATGKAMLGSASRTCGGLPLALLSAMGVHPAEAAGLLRMPPERLNNSYWLVRAGESAWESLGVINTNPVAKTNVDNGLSEAGKRQTAAAAVRLRQQGACQNGCWIWPSITQRAYQAAEIIAYANGITYSRIVPEYSFLDARGLGAYEGKGLDSLKEVYERDAESPKLRPPPFSNGTPNESVADVLVRVTQLMSILETQYSGDTVLIISPDSDNLSVLQAALTGLDLRRHSTLAFAPGEVRAVVLSEDKPPPLVSGYVSFR